MATIDFFCTYGIITFIVAIVTDKIIPFKERAGSMFISVSHGTRSAKKELIEIGGESELNKFINADYGKLSGNVSNVSTFFTYANVKGQRAVDHFVDALNNPDNDNMKKFLNAIEKQAKSLGTKKSGLFYKLIYNNIHRKIKSNSNWNTEVEVLKQFEKELRKFFLAKKRQDIEEDEAPEGLEKLSDEEKKDPNKKDKKYNNYQRKNNSNIIEKLKSGRLSNRLKVFMALVLWEYVINKIKTLTPEPKKQTYKGGLPNGVTRIFNVAVVSDEPETEKRVIDNLCNVGKKLESYFEVSGSEIDIDGKRLPKSSILIYDSGIIFSFYDVNVYGMDIIKECPYVLYIYTLDTTVSYDDWTKRMSKIRDKIKSKNQMCDLRFIDFIEGDYVDEKIGDYCRDLEQIASHELDIYSYQQTVNTYWIDTGSTHECCKFLIESLIKWDREKLFEQVQRKRLPILLNYDGKLEIYPKTNNGLK